MPPNTYTTIARVLSSMRAECWSTAQLVLLDKIIAALSDDLQDLNPRFSPDLFKSLSHYRYGRT